jgi:hypothetical protein
LPHPERSLRRPEPRDVPAKAERNRSADDGDPQEDRGWCGRRLVACSQCGRGWPICGTLSTAYSETFDAILACDYAIPHLLTDAEIGTAFSECRRCLRLGGVLVISVRDYAA